VSRLSFVFFPHYFGTKFPRRQQEILLYRNSRLELYCLAAFVVLAMASESFTYFLPSASGTEGKTMLMELANGNRTALLICF